jgi:hypothetical protein
MSGQGLMPARILFLLFLCFATPLAGQDPLLRVVPGRRIGPVARTSTLATLQAALGKAAAVAESLDVGEGILTPGVTLFPADSLRRAWVYWSDTIGFTRPTTVLIRSRGTRWTLPGGLTIGTALARLVELNGQPFRFSGFGWDYGGRASTWDGGKLEGILGPGMTLGVTLEPTCQDSMPAGHYEAIVGDVEISSEMPEAREACIVVDELWIGFTPP